MSGRAAPYGALAALASTLLVSFIGAAQPAPSPVVPPGLVPVFPPGVSAAPQVNGGGSPPNHSLELPASLPRAPPQGYYPPPYYLYPPGVVLQPPMQLPFEEGQTVPSGYELRRRRVRSLILAGSLTFSSTYLASVIVAAVNSSLRLLLAPVIGPFVTIGTAHSDAAGTLWLALDGMAQTAGAVLFVHGIVARETYLQRTETSALDVLAHPQVLIGPRAAVARWIF
jgi:hypothetical protein